jgi:carbonic anhydrase
VRSFVAAIATLVLLTACSGPTEESTHPEQTASGEQAPEMKHELHWDYGEEAGPAQWAKLHPDFALCGSGTAQSPIDLGGEIAETNEVEVRRLFEPVALTVSFQESTVEVLDNGHTIQISYEHGNSVEVGGVPFALS